MSQPRIAILLSTFNGEKWLPALLQSLLCQTLPFRLIWRDDGSSDETVSIVRDSGLSRLTEVVHSERGESLGPCASFGLLMKEAAASHEDLYFFADQDDLWSPKKIEVIYEKYAELNAEVPQLLHHNLRVIDFSGREISASLWHYMRLVPEQSDVAQFLTRNSVTGCGLAVNRALLLAATPLPDTAVMHDWWLGLVASACGGIHAIPIPLVDYRQHDRNVLGAEGFAQLVNLTANPVQRWRRGNQEFRALFPQAKSLLSALESSRLAEREQLRVIEQFLRLPTYRFALRLIVATRVFCRGRRGIFWFVLMLRVAFVRIWPSELDTERQNA